MRIAARAAIFDMDGLLIDSERVILSTWVEVTRSMGLPLEFDDFAPLVGRAAPESSQMLIALLGGDTAFQQARVRVNQRLEQLLESEGFAAKRGAQRIVAALAQRGIPCAVASSSRVAEIGRRLARVDLLKYFAATAGGDEVARGKPDPAVYRLAAQRLGVQPGECLAFEDSENGARAALAAGMRVVVVPDLRVPEAAILQHCLCTLASLDEASAQLPGWFMQGS